METATALAVLVGLGALGWFLVNRLPQESEEARQARLAKEFALYYGQINPEIVCSHCQRRGGVHTKPVEREAGVSAGKATGAILTGGLSLLATGLKRNEFVTRSFCSQCKSMWYF